MLLTAFCNHINTHMPMWQNRYFISFIQCLKLWLATWFSHYCYSESDVHHGNSGHYQMESIQLPDSCQLPFQSTVYEYLFNVVSDMTVQCKGKRIKCIHTCMTASHVAVVGVEQQIMYRESQCSHIFALEPSIYRTHNQSCLINYVCFWQFTQFYSLHFFILHYQVSV